MKFFINFVIFLKRFGFIYRFIGMALAIGLILEAVPDIIFNHQIKNIKNYTLNEVKKLGKDKLPRYFGISDVSAYGDLYVQNLKINHGDTSLSAITYPVYQNDEDVANLKEKECFVVVIDDKVNEGELSDYFMKNAHIKGKFDNNLIEEETKKILVDGGYKISDQCIVLTKGAAPWDTGICLIAICAAIAGFTILVLSFLSPEKLESIFKSKTIIM